MAESNSSKTETPPPHAQLVQMATAHWVSHIVYVAAKLGLADTSCRDQSARTTWLAPRTRMPLPSIVSCGRSPTSVS
jgi:hypothetical protein